MEQLYYEREDATAVMWTYADFRSANPAVDTHQAMEVAGYQMLKMGDVQPALELSKANAGANPTAATSAFGLGRRCLSREHDGFEPLLQPLSSSAEYDEGLRNQ